MRVLLNLPKEEKFNSLISPFPSRISIGNMVVEIGRGSFNSIFRTSFIGCHDVEEGTLSLRIGDYCEFSENVRLIIGGEHLSQNLLINTFSGSPQIRSQLIKNIKPINKGLIQVGASSVFSSGVTVLSGAEIGENVLIAAGSVCPKGNYSDNSIYGGIPAKILKKLAPLETKWWEYIEDDIVLFFKTGTTESLKKKYRRKVEIAFKGLPDRQGRITSLDMVGIYVEKIFIPLNSLSSEVKDYFDQVKSNTNMIAISDDIFKSYLI